MTETLNSYHSKRIQNIISIQNLKGILRLSLISYIVV